MEAESGTKTREVPVTAEVVGWLLILGGLRAELGMLVRCKIAEGAHDKVVKKTTRE